jgi:hypothetical protein
VEEGGSLTSHSPSVPKTWQWTDKGSSDGDGGSGGDSGNNGKMDVRNKEREGGRGRWRR